MTTLTNFAALLLKTPVHITHHLLKLDPLLQLKVWRSAPHLLKLSVSVEIATPNVLSHEEECPQHQHHELSDQADGSSSFLHEFFFSRAAPL